MSQSASPRPENIRIVGYSRLIVERATMIGGSGKAEKNAVVVQERLRVAARLINNCFNSIQSPSAVNACYGSQHHIKQSAASAVLCQADHIRSTSHGLTLPHW